MESSEKWCGLQDNCDLPISNGLLADADVLSNPLAVSSASQSVFPLMSEDVLSGNESNLTNSTCRYPFCVAVLSFTIEGTKWVAKIVIFLINETKSIIVAVFIFVLGRVYSIRTSMHV